MSTNRYTKHKDIIVSDAKTAITKTREHPNPLSTSQQFTNIQQALKDTIEHHEQIPKPRRKAWCDPKHKRQIRKQHALHEKRKNKPSRENIQKHTKYRNKLNKTIKQAKRKALTKQLEDTKKDAKQQAQVLKTVLPSKGAARASPTTLTYEGKTTTDPQEIADSLNNHYITIGYKTTQTILRKDQDEHIENEDNPTANKTPPSNSNTSQKNK